MKTNPQPVDENQLDDVLLAYLADLVRVYEGDNSALRAYISNHPSLSLMFQERLKTIIEMEIFYNFLDYPVKQVFKAAINVFGNWDHIIIDVEPINYYK